MADELNDWMCDLEKKAKSLEAQIIPGDDSKELSLRVDGLYNELKFLNNLKGAWEYVGKVTIPFKIEYEERLFYYYPDKQQGIILARNKEDFLPITFMAPISKEEFKNQHINPSKKGYTQSETKKIIKKHFLIGLPVVFSTAAYFVIRTILGKKE
jgi:hypothetical protein